MSFGKLKSARKVRELQSFVKPADFIHDGTSPTTVTPEHAVVSSYEPPESTAAEEQQDLTARNAGGPDDEPHTDNPSVDGARNESLAEEELDSKTEITVISGASEATTGEGPAIQPAQNKETPTLVDLQGCHTSLPASLEVRESARLGRGIYTKSALNPGSVVMQVLPHVHVLSSSYLDQHCSSCSAPAMSDMSLKRCPKCKRVYYCNQTCQNRDWAWHKNECDALQKWATAAPSEDVAVPSDAVRCLGRLLWGSQKMGFDSPWAREICMMQSHRSALPATSFESHAYLAHSLVRYLGASSPAELQPFGIQSSIDLVDLISRFVTNAFTLTSPSLTPIGVCIAPSIALANHSCSPNAVIVFPGAPGTPKNKEPLLNLIAIRDIAPGKEIRVSYIDTTLPRQIRQKSLTETYYFTCQCKLCSKPPPVDPREAVWCPKKCGGICPIPTEEDSLSRCAKCRAAVADTDAVLDATRIGQEALDKAVSLQFRDTPKAQRLTTNIIPILISAGLTPSSHPLLAMTHLHLELLITALPSSLSQESLDDAIRIAAKYSAALQSILPKGHPTRAIALGELGKLLAVDEPAPLNASDTARPASFPPSGAPRLKLAHESLVRAYEELLIGFGRTNWGGDVGRDVREAVVRLEKEIGVWTTGVRNVLQDTPAPPRAR